MIHGIHHIALHTIDLDETARFYAAAFGFEPEGEVFAWAVSPEIDRAIGVPGSAARSLMMRAGNCYVELFEYSAPPPSGTGPLRPQDRGYTHFAVDVSDIRAEMTRLAALGMRFADDAPLSGPGIRSIYGQDPDGNIIELQELDTNHPLALARAGRGG